MSKLISKHSEWARVAKELEAEDLKLASYDGTLLGLLGDAKGRRILDYGCGPGVLASALIRGRADIQIYDISPDMRYLAGEKIGHDRVCNSVEEIPRDYFDCVICNLVLCIVGDEVVPEIARNLGDMASKEGKIYTGFCNPLIFNVEESQLDLREPTGQGYGENHQYRKTKKEGGYQIFEEHRPLEWYEETFKDSGLVVLGKHFTPEYELKGNHIEDFVIFEMRRG